MRLLMTVFVFLVLNILAGPVNSDNTFSHCRAEHRNLTNLWRVNTIPPSYLFGTIHVPYTRVWDGISNNSKTAFLSADRVYFELDLTKTTEETKEGYFILKGTFKDIAPKLFQNPHKYLEFYI